MSEPYWVPLGAAPAPPAVPGFERIFDTTLGAAAAEILISSIPQTYAHLKILGSLRGDTAAGYVSPRIQMNGDTAANYDHQRMQAAAAGVSAAEGLGVSYIETLNGIPAASAPAGRFAPVELTLLDYRSLVNSKNLIGTISLIYGTGSSNLQLNHLLGVWRTSNQAVTSLRFFPSAGNFVAGSRLTLYGLI